MDGILDTEYARNELDIVHSKPRKGGTSEITLRRPAT
jgi:hypothetical protein